VTMTPVWVALTWGFLWLTEAQMCQPVIGGQQYDLSPLEGPVFITVGPETPEGFKYVYQIQLCKDISKPMIPQCQGSSICQYMNSGNEYLYLSSVSSWSSRPYPVWSFINPADTSEGLVLTSENGGMCGSSGFRRQMNFFFNCSSSRQTSVQVIADSIHNCPAPGLSCCYNFQITTHLACPDQQRGGGGAVPGYPLPNPGPGGGGIVAPGNPPPPGYKPNYQYPGSTIWPNPGGVGTASGQAGGTSTAIVPDDEGLSTGWWFLIMLFGGIGLYIALGCAYNIQTRNVTGIDACPHLSFWREVPGLIRDGCSVSYTVGMRLLRMVCPCNRMFYQQVS